MRFKRFTFLFSIALICLLTFNFATAAVSNNPSGGPLSFQDRVKYQHAIEEVYWRHRIWPKENPGLKPPLEKILPDSAIIAKVEDYLRKSNALEQYWKKPITAQQLQAEMDRVVKNTKQPQLLKEIFSALNNDPHIIAECLARPAIVDRLMRNWYANDDRFHGDLRQRVKNELRGISAQSMRALSGKYSEVEGVKKAKKNAIVDPAQISLNAQEWKEWTDQLQTIFGKQIQTQKLSSVLEETDRIYVMAVNEKANDGIKIAIVEWPKKGFDSWWSDERKRTPVAIIEEFATYTLKPLDTSSSCIDDTWTPTLGPFPESRGGHTAVWTGTETILWGGRGYSSNLSSGARYDPSTDSWSPTSMVNAPQGRVQHTAVWTGTDMIVWGGATENEYLTTGAKYDPKTDSWSAINNVDVPEARIIHSAVWTGSEMIIWGGSGYTSNALATGGRYDPYTDSWAATTIVNAPQMRYGHTAIWTGAEMIIWGGSAANSIDLLSSGGRYDPSTDSWRPTSIVNAPQGREFHTAIWTGNEMIIWGGWGYGLLSSGARYDPLTDSWTSTSEDNVPVSRMKHTTIWTGAEMIVWGGTGLDVGSSGARYNPSTDSWTATSIVNVPEGRYLHTAIWTGTEMIVWGGFGDINGYISTGSRYDPSTNSWVPTNAVYVPTSRELHTAIWTGTEMIVWGGRGFGLYSTGGRYKPVIDDWTSTSSIDAPAARIYHTAVWTGLEMIVWGGAGGGGLSSGGRYDPSSDSWTPTSTSNVPEGREMHTAVWTGTEMIVWGGRTYYELSSGGRYDPSTDSWVQTSITNVPESRIMHTAVWTGSEMIIWGGSNYNFPFPDFLASGGRYNPGTDSWTDTYMDILDSPEPRADHTAVWTGTEMIVWGGFNYVDEILNTPYGGGSYNPSMDRWTQFVGGIEGRYHHTAVWTGSEMIVWGGRNSNFDNLSTGGRYIPSVYGWRATSLLDAPEERGDHTAIWTDTEMIVWGGSGRYGSSALQTGALYCVGPSLQISNASVEEGKKGRRTLKFFEDILSDEDFRSFS